jgi:hypothetical protein
MVSTGYVSPGAAASTDAHLGIAVEYATDPTSTGLVKIGVITNKRMRYRVQTKTGFSTPTIARVFETSTIVTYAVGNTTTHQSIMALDDSGTSHLPWVILGLWDSPTNSWADGAIVVVRYGADIALAAQGFPGI